VKSENLAACLNTIEYYSSRPKKKKKKKTESVKSRKVDILNQNRPIIWSINVALRSSNICTAGNSNVSSRWSNGAVAYIASQDNAGTITWANLP
jgi:hypothetical protein